LSSIRVRFAPSPTGELHVGGARTAILNWLFARKNKGAFILRVDDTDSDRSERKFVDNILESLEWLGIDWDEGPGRGGEYVPYYQSERLDLYKKEINRLLENGRAYWCFCTEEELQEGREEAKRKGIPFLYPGKCRNLENSRVKELKENNLPCVVRLMSPEEGKTTVEDQIKGEVVFENRHLDDFIILKSNGLPTYNFASAVDDVYMQISHVIRAEEHLSNTPRQLMLIEAMGYRPPLFAHVPVILAPDKTKLSKRHGATSVEEFRARGFLAEALTNYLVLMGWAPPDDEELFTMDKAVMHFDINKVGKTAAVFDEKKLAWINGHYIREADLDRLTEISIPFLQNKGMVPDEITSQEKDMVKTVLEVSRERIKSLEELPELCDFFFTEDFAFHEDALKKVFSREETSGNLELVYKKLASLEELSPENIQASFKELSEENNISLSKIVKPVRAALSGKLMGPELNNIMIILGKEKVLERIEKAKNLKT